MKKYLYTVLLSLLVCVSGKAEDWFESGLFRYEILSYVGSGGTVKITGFSRNTNSDDIETLDIPTEVPTYSFKIVEIGDNAFSYSRNLKKVTMSNSITKIGNNAFRRCYELETISLSSAIKEIGNFAFEGCTSLMSSTIPNSVKSIGQSAFQNCCSLEQISLPKDLEVINESLFRGCTYLIDIVLPSSIIEIDDYAFSGCNTLQNIVLPEGLLYIDDYAFRGCNALQNIVLPEGLLYIGNFSFSDCLGLKSVSIPKSLKEIGMNPFKGCSSMDFLLLNDNSYYHLYDGALYQTDILKLISCPVAKTKLEIEPLTEIFSYSCFAGCVNLEEITIPKTIREICFDAFSGCTSLKTIQCEIEDVYSCNPGFSNYDASLLVPKGMIDIYSSVEPWKNFKNIKEISSSGLEEVLDYSESGIYIIDRQIYFESKESVQIRNLSGQILYEGSSTFIPKLDFGIYLLTWSNRTLKVLVQ